MILSSRFSYQARFYRYRLMKLITGILRSISAASWRIRLYQEKNLKPFNIMMELQNTNRTIPKCQYIETFLATRSTRWMSALMPTLPSQFPYLSMVGQFDSSSQGGCCGWNVIFFSSRVKLNASCMHHWVAFQAVDLSGWQSQVLNPSSRQMNDVQGLHCGQLVFHLPKSFWDRHPQVLPQPISKLTVTLGCSNLPPWLGPGYA
mmetsp:Transcript_3376/g.5837  ORF Transcript_3376/g.5837 Transcript_3376/m.5837 type:complete len:204 (+) Transcript_3376:115-726(+)